MDVSKPALEKLFRRAVSLRLAGDYTSNVQGVASKVFKALPHNDLTRVIVTLWALWHARRKALYEGMFQSRLSTNCFVEQFLSDLQVTAPAASKVQGRETRRPAWIPSLAGMAKVNVDASTSKNYATSTIGVVVHREDGAFLGASSCWSYEPGHP
jgi:hypothetical protein